MSRTFKSWLIIAVTLQLVLLLAACGGDKDSGNDAAASPSSVSEQQNDSGEEGCPASEEGFTTFQDHVNDVCVAYPDDWSMQKDSDAFYGFVAPLADDKDKYQENVSLQINSMEGQSFSLQEYADYLTEQAKQSIEDFKLTYSENAEAEEGEEDVADTYYLEYTGTQNGLKMKFESFLILDSGRTFIFTYSAEEDSYDQYYGIYEQIGDSLLF